MFRSHPGLVPLTSAQLWDPDSLEYTRLMSKLFADLTPYREALFSEAAAEGLPLVRHGILVQPEDNTWFNNSLAFSQQGCKAGNQIGLFQFYFGDDVIVVPALRKGIQDVYAYIPEGTWTHFWLNQTVQGPSYKAWKAPLGQPVFFYRTSSTWAAFFAALSLRYASQTNLAIV